MDRDTRNNVINFLASIFQQNEHGYSFNEVQHKWLNWTENRDQTPLSSATFRRYRDRIRKYIGLDIKYINHVYKVVSNNPKDENKLRDWGISLQAINARIQGCESISNRILLEDLPSSTFLDYVLSSMRNNNIIEITYREYGQLSSEIIAIQPYCIKTYHNRWYVLGKCEDNEFRIYCMDRMESVMATDKTFIMDPNFNANDFFSEFYAVRLDKEVKPEKVVLRAHENERFILNRQPIHQSQKLRCEGNNYWDFEYYLRPTFDFVSYLESQGRFLEVIKPHWLRKELVRVHTEAIKQNQI